MELLCDVLFWDLTERIRTLKADIDEIYDCQFGGPSVYAAGIDLVTPKGVGEAAKQLLVALRGYPDIHLTRAQQRRERSSRSDTAASKLRIDIGRTVNATSLLHSWFSAPQNARVPSALATGVMYGLLDLGVQNCHPIIAAGPPSQVDIVVTDARRVFFPGLDALKPGDARHLVVRAPAYETENPMWWPIVLGHEVAHQKLEISETSWDVTASEANVFMEKDAGDRYRRSRLLLAHLDVLDKFPATDMRRAVLADRGPTVASDSEADESRYSTRMEGSSGKLPILEEMANDESQVDLLVASKVAVANSWAREIVCDLFMVHRFGPAAVAAMATFLSASGKYGTISETHPPAYLRILLMLKTIDSSRLPPPMRSIVRAWEAYYSPQVTEDVRGALSRSSSLLATYMEKIRPELSNLARDWCVNPYESNSNERVRAVLLAVRQLAFGVPPFDDRELAFPLELWSEYVPDQELGARLVELTDADVINAGWIAVADQSARKRGKDGTIDSKVPIARLLLKSIETIYMNRRVRSHGTVSPISQAPLSGEQEPLPSEVHDANQSSLRSDYPGAVLSPQDIRERLSEVSLGRRIIVSSRLDEDVKQPSIDLRLGNRFIVFQRSSLTSFNSQSGSSPRSVQKLIERPFGSPFVLHPNEVVLAGALEYLALPRDVSAQVITRSAYGRLGLITATAVQVHPMYRGCLTLELVNLGNVPMELFPGERVAQLVFFGVNGASDTLADPKERFSGSYVCPTGPEFPDVRSDELLKVLNSD